MIIKHIYRNCEPSTLIHIPRDRIIFSDHFNMEGIFLTLPYEIYKKSGNVGYKLSIEKNTHRISKEIR